MKKFFLFTIGLFLVNVLYGQGIAGIIPPNQDKYKVLDSATFKFTYEFTYILDTTKLNSPMKSQLFLLVGPNISKFSSFTFLKSEKNKNRTSGRDGAPRALGEGLDATEVFKNIKTRKETVTIRLFGTADIFEYEEDIPLLKWEITNETSTILSYTCTKAKTIFRGRTYTAWFTTEIPINNGPWKLGGLPGMILKVSDASNHFTFSCIGIEQLKKKEPIVRFGGDYVSTSRKEIEKLIKLMHDNPLQYFGAIGLMPPVNRKEVPSQPYNPLEKI